MSLVAASVAALVSVSSAVSASMLASDMAFAVASVATSALRHSVVAFICLACCPNFSPADVTASLSVAMVLCNASASSAAFSSRDRTPSTTMVCSATMRSIFWLAEISFPSVSFKLSSISPRCMSASSSLFCTAARASSVASNFASAFSMRTNWSSSFSDNAETLVSDSRRLLRTSLSVSLLTSASSRSTSTSFFSAASSSSFV